eukprot:TCONS_00040351-protein
MSPHDAMATYKIDLGSGYLRGPFFAFGKKEDYTYDVPENVIHVSIDQEDQSANTLNVGNGNGKAKLRWDQASRKAHVHAWVNSAVGRANEIHWTVYCWVKA